MKKSSKICLCFNFLLLFSANVFSQGDSLLYYYSQAKTPSAEKVRPLIQKFNGKDSAKITQVGSKIYNKENKVNYYDQVAERFYLQDDYDNARLYYARSLNAAKETLDKSLIAEELSSLGDIYRLQDQNAAALNYLFQAVYLYKDLGMTEKMAHNLALIGDINRCVEHYPDALKYLNEALELCVKNNWYKDEGFCCSSIGGVYQLQKNYDKALYYYKKGLELSVAIKDTVREIDFNYSTGDLLVEQGKCKEALTYLNKALDLDKIVKDNYHMGFCYMGLAKADLQQKLFSRSIDEGLKAYQYGVLMNAPGLRAHVAKILYQAYSQSGDFKNGFKFLKINYDLYDSVISTDNIKEQTQI
ncbi:MAG: tetratricopeptide repeat protein, partial [Chlamydiota bacterium]